MKREVIGKRERKVYKNYDPTELNYIMEESVVVEPYTPKTERMKQKLQRKFNKTKVWKLSLVTRYKGINRAVEEVACGLYPTKREAIEVGRKILRR